MLRESGKKHKAVSNIRDRKGDWREKKVVVLTEDEKGKIKKEEEQRRGRVNLD